MHIAQRTHICKSTTMTEIQSMHIAQPTHIYKLNINNDISQFSKFENGERTAKNCFGTQAKNKIRKSKYKLYIGEKKK
jgi:hypothetical protein